MKFFGNGEYRACVLSMILWTVVSDEHTGDQEQLLDMRDGEGFSMYEKVKDSKGNDLVLPTSKHVREKQKRVRIVNVTLVEEDGVCVLAVGEEKYTLTCVDENAVGEIGAFATQFSYGENTTTVESEIKKYNATSKQGERHLQANTAPHYYSPSRHSSSGCNWWQAMVQYYVPEQACNLKLKFHVHNFEAVLTSVDSNSEICTCGDNNNRKSRTNRPIITAQNNPYGWIWARSCNGNNPLFHVADFSRKSSVVYFRDTIAGIAGGSCKYMEDSSGIYIWFDGSCQLWLEPTFQQHRDGSRPWWYACQTSPQYCEDGGDYTNYANWN